MKICDAHTDFLTEIKDRKERERYVKSIRKIKGAISCAVFTTNSTICLKDVENYKLELDYYNKKYHTEFLLSIEDLGFIKDVTELKNLIKLKPFSVSLTWNFKNQFAGGANSNSGLTKFGKLAIKMLEKNNILIDTAHLNRKSFYEFIKITTQPIYNSHSNIYSLHNHKRNLTNQQIKKIVEANGFLGVSIYKDFISNNEISSCDIASQFDYLIKKFGYKNFGFGTDFYGINTMPKDVKTYQDFKFVKKHLREFGYSNDIINHVFYKNFYVFKNNKINKKEQKNY